MSIGVLTIAPDDAGAAPMLHAERTFFGVYRVTQRFGGRIPRAVARNDAARHAGAAIRPEQGEPLTYFHREGPFGQAFAGLPNVRRAKRRGGDWPRHRHARRLCATGQRWTFYEIDQAVERIARDPSYFTYLQDCGERCRVVIGDARLSLAGRPAIRYVMVLDAFSSDSIPMHLLTQRSAGTLSEGPQPNGVILFHISNRHLTLAPIVGRLAKEHNLAALANTDKNVRTGLAAGHRRSG